MNYLTIIACKNWTIARLLFVGLVALSLMPVQAALADDPDQAPASGRSSGGRGCGTTMPSTMPSTPSPSPQSNLPSLILLTPQGDLQKTVSARPQFAWFVRDAAPIGMEFRLYAQAANKQYTLIKEIKDDQFKTTPGINVLTLAPTGPELPIGRYRWQVVLVCDQNRPSSNLFATAEIEILPLGAGRPANPPDRFMKDALLDQMSLSSAERQRLQESPIHSIER
jgi:Domain of Unknown Function (DUF928)